MREEIVKVERVEPTAIARKEKPTATVPHKRVQERVKEFKPLKEETAQNAQEAETETAEEKETATKEAVTKETVPKETVTKEVATKKVVTVVKEAKRGIARQDPKIELHNNQAATVAKVLRHSDHATIVLVATTKLLARLAIAKTTDLKSHKRMKVLLKSSILLLLASWLTTACVEHTVYHTYQSIPNEGWDKHDTLTFVIPITDSLPTTLQVTAEVRSGNKYPYQNLFIVVSHNLQDSTTFETDTLALSLADNEGNWKGSAWGSLRQSSLPLGKVSIKGSGNYLFKVSHGMKDEVLPGIRDVGVYLSK